MGVKKDNLYSDKPDSDVIDVTHNITALEQRRVDYSTVACQVLIKSTWGIVKLLRWLQYLCTQKALMAFSQQLIFCFQYIWNNVKERKKGEVIFRLQCNIHCFTNTAADFAIP